MEKEQSYFDIALSDGQSVRCAILPNEKMREFAKRLKETAGVTIGISNAVIDGQTYDENTEVLKYFSAHIKTESEEDEATTVYETYVDNDGGIDEKSQISAVDEEGSGLAGLFCSVAGCGSNKLDCPDLAMFQLPQDEQRCAEWIAALGREDILLQDKSRPLIQELSVCSNHFLADQFVDKTRETLKHTAVPTLFLHCDSLHTNDSHDDAQLEKNSDPTKCGLTGDGEEIAHPGVLCRLCAEPLQTCPIYIFDNSNSNTDKQNISELINSCLPILVSKTDVLPKQICQVCHQRLLLQASFAKACSLAEEKLTMLTRLFVTNNAKKVVKTKEKTKSKNAQNHTCPLCCFGGMEMVSTDGDTLLTQDVDSVDQSQELYSDDDDVDGDEKHTPEDLLSSASSYVDNPMDLLYLPEDRKLAYECEICDEAFMTGMACEQHCKSHSSDDYHPCVVCGLVFASEHLFDTHFFNHKLLKQLGNSKKTSGRTTLTCGTCKIQVNTRKEFILHVCSKPIVVTKVEPPAFSHQCELCEQPRVFTTAARAKVHQLEHTGDSSDLFTCAHCSLQFNTKKMLDYHLTATHFNVKHECHECGLRFLSIDHLNLHSKIHKSGAVKYQCSQCDKLFPTLVDITMHIQSHFAKNERKKLKLKCFKCNTYFEKREEVERHLENTHDCIERMPSLIQYQCKICSERIKSSSEVLVHRRVHWKRMDPAMPFLCEYCGEPHASPNALARHRRYLHPDEQPYVCTLCDKKTRTLYEARVHRKTHTGYEPTDPRPQPKIYQCDECPSLFSDRNRFITHKKSHSALRFPCELCDKTYKTKCQLVGHQLNHKEGKPFACGTCGKKFTQSSAMYSHARLHTGETPYGCDICGQMYRTKADRDSHRRKHTGEKPYKCEFCGKRFRTGQVYYQHRMIHTDDRRFRCDICGKGFKRSHTLVCHRRIHTGEKPNVCDICGKGFRQRTDMRKHKANMHATPC